MTPPISTPTCRPRSAAAIPLSPPAPRTRAAAPSAAAAPPPGLLAEVGRSHPALTTSASYQGSRSYRGHDHAKAMFAADLPPIHGPVTVIDVTQAGLAARAPRR